jgi:hypothetical protein
MGFDFWIYWCSEKGKTLLMGAGKAALPCSAEPLTEATAGVLRSARRINAQNVFGFGPLFTGDDIEGDLIAGLQGFESFAKDARMMDEDILAGLLGNEPEPFRVIPPFNSSTRHSSSLLNTCGRRPKNYGQKTAKAGQVTQ